MDILFWSGGKDSYLALKLYKQENAGQPLKLLTTYDENSGRIPFQNLSIQTIRRQATKLGLDVLSIPLPPNCPNDIYLENIGETLNSQDDAIRYLVFGDWLLSDIRQWREQQFDQLGFSCKFPIWQESFKHLLNILTEEPIEIRLSHVAEKYEQWIRVGEPYDREFVERLPDHINPMGEKGEFHTEVVFTN